MLPLLFITLIFTFITLLLINVIAKNDTNKNTSKINSLIIKFVEEEEENNFNIDFLKEKILLICKQEDLIINDLFCSLIDNKLIVKYSYKNINRLSSNEIEFLI